ncbi:MAG: hypothetical protein KIT19_11495 [Phycisphaeraceae bacterium]|nr:hypothetical protein [Phycisphaeraceae bacterium]
MAGNAMASASRVDPPRRVEVHVTVTTNGAPFPEGTIVTLGVPGETFEGADVPTDASGNAVLIAEFPPEVTIVSIDIPSIISWGPSEQVDVRNDAANLADKAFSLPSPRLITLVPGQEIYTVDFFAPEAVSVRGRTVDGQGGFFPSHANRGGVFNLRFHPDSRGGFFEVFGVPKGQDSFLFLSMDRPDTHVVWLTAAQTGVDLDLGNVVVPTITSDAVVEIAVTGRNAVRSDLGVQNECVTLIHEDGLLVYTLKITEQGGVTTYPEGENDTALPQVASGRYYIVPGMSNTSDSSLKALRLIRSGQRALLDAGGVPVIEPVSGQTTSGAIDLAAVQQIIDGLPE